jgi:hypothetical protein
LCPARATVPTAGVAQLVEHLICNQRVRGSNPFASSRIASGITSIARRDGIRDFPTALHKEFFQVRCSVRDKILAHFYVFASLP